MTNLEAIRAKLNYPLSDNAFIVALEDRGVTSDEVYASGQAFDLAYADTITMLVTSPNITEGGFSINMTEKATLLSLADKIYTKYGVANPIGSLKAKATFVQRF
jgi:hypothetical protein